MNEYQREIEAEANRRFWEELTRWLCVSPPPHFQCNQMPWEQPKPSGDIWDGLDAAAHEYLA